MYVQYVHTHIIRFFRWNFSTVYIQYDDLFIYFVEFLCHFRYRYSLNTKISQLGLDRRQPCPTEKESRCLSDKSLTKPIKCISRNK